MAYDLRLADRIRVVLDRLGDFSEKKNGSAGSVFW
jgi:hypothetical protein